eukprot:6183973-Pleurochrysis_carterae.AAC.3
MRPSAKQREGELDPRLLHGRLSALHNSPTQTATLSSELISLGVVLCIDLVSCSASIRRPEFGARRKRQDDGLRPRGRQQHRRICPDTKGVEDGSRRGQMSLKWRKLASCYRAGQGANANQGGSVP